jgi:hypothetical protein
MTTSEASNKERDPEFDAMRAVYTALKDLDAAAQNRVLDYVFKRLKLTHNAFEPEAPGTSFSPQKLAEEVQETTGAADDGTRKEDEDSLAGVSSVAQKWIRRNGLTAAQLSKIFSLGLDQIELVARSVPGTGKKNRMRNVLLLSCTASYLGTGAARTDDETLRESLAHYNAYDAANFARDIRALGPEVSGSKESGYTLTARGLAAAADLIKEMTTARKSN